jgi:phage shock protein A
MADINFLGRLSNLWSGFVSLWITDVEKRHPEIAYQNAIDSMIEKYGKLKSATAAIMRRREDDLVATRKRTRRTGGGLGRPQCRPRHRPGRARNRPHPEEERARSERQDARAGDGAGALPTPRRQRIRCCGVKSEIQKLKDEKDRMLAQMQSAQARLKIQNQLEGLSVDAEVRALDNVREHIKNTVAEAKMGSELRDSDLDVKLARLRQSSGAITARQQLEEMKRARAAQGEAAGKSM